MFLILFLKKKKAYTKEAFFHNIVIKAAFKKVYNFIKKNFKLLMNYLLNQLGIHYQNILFSENFIYTSENASKR